MFFNFVFSLERGALGGLLVRLHGQAAPADLHYNVFPSFHSQGLSPTDDARSLSLSLSLFHLSPSHLFSQYSTSSLQLALIVPC